MYTATAGGRPTSIVVAAGPFTTKTDMSFEPLEELLTAAAALQGGPPVALLLTGPFLDAGHPVVAGAQLDTSFQHVFEQEVSWHTRLVAFSLMFQQYCGNLEELWQWNCLAGSRSAATPHTCNKQPAAGSILTYNHRLMHKAHWCAGVAAHRRVCDGAPRHARAAGAVAQ